MTATFDRAELQSLAASIRARIEADLKNMANHGVQDYTITGDRLGQRGQSSCSHDSITQFSSKMEAPDSEDFPEGGITAWSVVAGAWCCIFVSTGWIACIGDFQAYYQANQLRNYSPSSIGWIPSTQIFTLFIFAPIYSHVFHSYGPRPLLTGGTLVHIFSLLMLSLSTSYYQIFLVQSICSAVGASAIFWAAGLTISTWFRRRRGLACGIAASGSPIGGIVGTSVIPSLFQSVGFGSTMRAVAFAYLCLLVIAILTVRSGLKHKLSRFQLSDVASPLSEWRLVALSLAGFFLSIGIYVPYGFLVVEASANSMSQTSANNLLVILNTAGIFGCVAPAWPCDRFGHFNVTIASTFITALLIFAMWIPAGGDALRNGFAALYGIFSGAILSIVVTLATRLRPDTEKLGVCIGTMALAMSPGILIALPISGALVVDADQAVLPYLPMKLFCGFAVCIGGAFLIAARASHIRARRTDPLNSEGEMPYVSIRIILS